MTLPPDQTTTMTPDPNRKRTPDLLIAESSGIVGPNVFNRGRELFVSVADNLCRKDRVFVEVVKPPLA